MFSKNARIIGILVLCDALLIVSFFTSFQEISLAPDTIAQRIAQKCFAGVSSNQPCLHREFAALLDEHGFTLVSEALLRYQSIDSKTRNCHILAHEITQSFMRTYFGDWKELLHQINPASCGGGFMHGVLEARMGDDPGFNVDKKAFEEICVELFASDNFETSCAHILGHILFVEKNGDMEPSLDICRGLEGEMAVMCSSGVFMEDSFRINFLDHELGSEPVKNKQWFSHNLERCQAIKDSENIETGCFFDLAGVAAVYFRFNPADVYGICALAHIPRAREDCYLRASSIIAVEPYVETARIPFSDLCTSSIVERSVNTRCVARVVSALLGESLFFVDRGVRFCESRNAGDQRLCFETLGGQIKNRVSEKDVRMRLCQPLPDFYRESCMQ